MIGDFILSYGIRASGVLAGLVFMSVFSWVVPSSSGAEILYIITLVPILVQVSCFGNQPFIVKEIAQHDSIRDVNMIQSRYFYVSFLFSVVVLLAMFIFHLSLSDTPVAYLFILFSVPFLVVQTLRADALRGIGLLILPQTIPLTYQGLTILALVLCFGNPLALSLLLVCAAVVSLSIYLLLPFDKPFKVESGVSVDNVFFNRGSKVFISTLTKAFMASSPVLLSNWLGLEELSLSAAVAFKFITPISLLSLTCISVSARKYTKEKNSLIPSIHALIVGFLSILTIFLILFLSDYINIIFSESYQFSADIFCFIAFGQTLGGMLIISEYYLNIHGKERVTLFFNIISLCFSVLLFGILFYFDFGEMLVFYFPIFYYFSYYSLVTVYSFLIGGSSDSA